MVRTGSRLTLGLFVFAGIQQTVLTEEEETCIALVFFTPHKDRKTIRSDRSISTYALQHLDGSYIDLRDNMQKDKRSAFVDLMRKKQDEEAKLANDSGKGSVGSSKCLPSHRPRSPPPKKS